MAQQDVSFALIGCHVIYSMCSFFLYVLWGLFHVTAPLQWEHACWVTRRIYILFIYILYDKLPSFFKAYEENQHGSKMQQHNYIKLELKTSNDLKSARVIFFSKLSIIFTAPQLNSKNRHMGNTVKLWCICYNNKVNKVTDCQLVEVFSSLHNIQYVNNTCWTCCPLSFDILIVTSFDWRLFIFYSLSSWLTKLFLKGLMMFDSLTVAITTSSSVFLSSCRTFHQRAWRVLSYRRSNIHRFVYFAFSCCLIFVSFDLYLGNVACGYEKCMFL